MDSYNNMRKRPRESAGVFRTEQERKMIRPKLEVIDISSDEGEITIVSRPGASSAQASSSRSTRPPSCPNRTSGSVQRARHVNAVASGSGSGSSSRPPASALQPPQHPPEIIDVDALPQPRPQPTSDPEIEILPAPLQTKKRGRRARRTTTTTTRAAPVDVDVIDVDAWESGEAFPPLPASVFGSQPPPSEEKERTPPAVAVPSILSAPKRDPVAELAREVEVDAPKVVVASSSSSSSSTSTKVTTTTTKTTTTTRTKVTVRPKPPIALAQDKETYQQQQRQQRKKKRSVPWKHIDVWVEIPISRYSILKTRATLQRKWNKSTPPGTALLRLVNDVDDEAVPPVGGGFVYLERGYVYGEDTPRPPHPYQLQACNPDHCGWRCDDAQLCGCQRDQTETPGDFAYDDQGLFRHLDHMNQGATLLVIECNKKCGCDLACLNRVSQRPRDVPIEIFKTEKRGWGVRSSVDVVDGKVLGIYTGLLIPRKVAEVLTESEYCFDLDGGEQGDEDDDGNEGKFSVDAMHHGNWTRFINHSCEPNLKVYSVVYDTKPEMHTPYLVFVALKDIPAGQEFLFDYDPTADGPNVEVAVNERGELVQERSIRAEMPEGAYACHCGAALCRGWVRTC